MFFLIPACGHPDESVSIRCVRDPPTFLNEFKCLMSLFAFAVDRRFDVCMLTSACFVCVCVNACVMTQLGGCLKSRRIQKIWGLFRHLSDHSYRGLIVIHSRWGEIGFMLTNK